MGNEVGLANGGSLMVSGSPAVVCGNIIYTKSGSAITYRSSMEGKIAIYGNVFSGSSSTVTVVDDNTAQPEPDPNETDEQIDANGGT